MSKGNGHGFRNFVLIVLTIGIAYYFWKEREKRQDEPDYEEIVEVDIIETDEPEPEEEPALVTAVPLDEEAEVTAGTLDTPNDPPSSSTNPQDDPVPSSSTEPSGEGGDPASDESPEVVKVPENETPTDELFPEPVDDEELLPEANEPGIPEIGEEVEEKEPTWVQPVDGECPEGFPIKARFATGHFHVPGDRGYDKIVPDCCYPSIADAEADGFTPSRWA